MRNAPFLQEAPAALVCLSKCSGVRARGFIHGGTNVRSETERERYLLSCGCLEEASERERERARESESGAI